MKKIKNINIFTNNNFQIGNITFTDHIEKIETNKTTKMANFYLIPTFFDTHTHGGYGVDFNEIHKCNSLKIKKMIDNYKKEGIGNIFITTVTDKISNLKKIALKIKKLIKLDNFFLGWHLEGPFISKEKSGAHNKKLITPIKESFLKWLKKNCDFPIIITFAPEIKNNLEIAYKYKNEFFWSIGHSNAHKTIIEKAIKLGFNRITHLFNAMGDLNHKFSDETLVNYALTRNLYSEIITDQIHVNKSCIKIANNLINKNNLFIISDSLSCKGLKNGKYFLQKLPIVKVNDACYLQKSKILAGSCTKYNILFKKMLNITHNIHSLVFYTSINAFKYLKLKQPKIEKNQVANFILIDKKGNIKAIYNYGKRIK